MGIKEIRYGNWVSNEFPFSVGTGPCKRLPDNRYITGKMMHRHKGLEYVFYTPSFHFSVAFILISVWN